MDRFLTIMVGATLGYYAGKMLDTKNDAANILVGVVIASAIDGALNDKK
ncbi:MAG: hypothetical protein V4538_02345 [Bacteroidota bacterium]